MIQSHHRLTRVKQAQKPYERIEQQYGKLNVKAVSV